MTQIIKGFYRQVDSLCMTHTEDMEDIDKLNDSIEPGFYLGLNKSRKLPVGINATHTLNNFEYRLKENPNDLSCHLQRIQFAITDKNRTALFASICDLFIVLGTQGLPLRQHLFTTCRKALNQKQLELIEDHLTDKQLTGRTMALPDNCFFKKEPFEPVELIDHSLPENISPEDCLHIAESYIENSQFDTALEYMEAQLEHEPGNKEMTLKLISLYKALGCADRFQSTYKKYSAHVTTSIYWNEAQNHFLNQ